MKRKTLWLSLSCLMLVAMILTSCGTKTEPTTTPTTTNPTTTPSTTPTITPTTSPTTAPTTTPTATTGNWWDKYGDPQYGGTMNVQIATDPPRFDGYYGGLNPLYYFEHLGIHDWTVNPDEWSFQTAFCPDEYKTGLLAESWETPDLQTIIYNLHKGVHWQDKSPVNGRELTADDIAYSYQRQYGVGGGFTKASPFVTVAAFEDMESVTATDKYTVVFKWKVPSILIFQNLMDANWQNYIYAKEAVDTFGSMQDWHNAVGTGPFILKDYVSGSALTYNRNPSYWGSDPRHPENQLPYVDEFKQLIIPDRATTLAAFRTGKIDYIADVTLTDATNLIKANPQLVKINTAYYGFDIGLRCDKEPFTDIRVRKALQLAIDLETIAMTYDQGTKEPIPCGLVNPVLKGYCFPYDQWPQELKDEYAYNPEGAKKLLAEAGYPNGFKTNAVTISTTEMDLVQIFKAYFADIGVDMEIKVMDSAAWRAVVYGGLHDQMYISQTIGYSTGLINPPDRNLMRRYSKHYSNFTHNNDPVFDAFFEKLAASTNVDEQKQISRDADRYSIEQHWSINYLPGSTIKIHQPWFKGYGGEYSVPYSKVWIDWNLKKSQGY